MSNTPFDVVIVGAGCAGLSAGIGLARAGLGVAVLEAAAYPGAENWSGCVYFCENLAHPDLLGPKGVEGLAWERQLVQRGAFVADGRSLFGQTFRDPKSFRHCYTVLRPVFDHHLSQLAVQAGVVLLRSTTAESLIRDGERVIGVATNRGPVYGDLTFLAEGDASHLVSREGYERLPAGQKQPRFLHGIKEIIDLPPGAVEENFGLGAGEGAAYEIILRNARLNGKSLHLNMGGFIYTNRHGLSVGLVLPADHLHDHFEGDPNLLIEWFENLPDLQPWFRGGRRGVFGAKLIRGGGIKELPQLIDHGLAIGGAASGIGVDFPYPNYTGPATAMGLQLVRAVKAIRATKSEFSRSALDRHYLKPLQQTRYWKDVDFLRDWPDYVERTTVFFDRQADLILATARRWSGPEKNWRRTFQDWASFLVTESSGDKGATLRADLALFRKGLPAAEVVVRPSLFGTLFYGWVNAMREWVGKPAGGSAGGELRLHYTVNGKPGAGPSAPVEKFLRRLQPAVAAAAREVYRNDATPLPEKFRAAYREFVRHSHLGAMFFAARLALLGAITAIFGRKRQQQVPVGQDAENSASLADSAAAPDLTPIVPQAQQKWEDRLGRLGYLSPKRSHIHSTLR